MATFNKSIELSGRKYTINQFPATKGLRVLSSLVKVLGLPLAHLFSGGKNADVAKVLPMVVNALSDRMDDDRVVAIIKDLLSTTTFEGQVVGDTIFDQHFMGRIGDVFKLSVEVVRYQFEDFLSVALAAGMKEMAKTEPSSLTMSNG